MSFLDRIFGTLNAEHPERHVAVQGRHDPVSRGPWRTGPSRNVRVVEQGQFSYAAPYDPPRRSDFNGMGKASGLSRRPMAIFTNVADVLAIDEPDFAKGPASVSRARVPSVTRGLQTPMGERANVERPQAVRYGNLVTMSMPPYFGYVPTHY